MSTFIKQNCKSCVFLCHERKSSDPPMKPYCCEENPAGKELPFTEYEFKGIVYHVPTFEVPKWCRVEEYQSTVSGSKTSG